MTGRDPRKQLWRALGLVLLMTLIWSAGCGTPHERYRVLSFFFDGVPDPDKPKTVAKVATTGPATVQLSILSRHKPYMENKCDVCHRSAAGEIQEFSEAYKVCVQCHAQVPRKYPKMHGPVAVGACKWCHAPHESVYPSLLKDAPLKLCTQCHEPNLLGNKPPAHNDGRTSCLDCHSGHGGTAAHFLKPGAVPQWPTTRPATRPADEPTTAPATRAAEGSTTSPPAALGSGPDGGS